MLLVALTGGIATGKSYVLARAAARGVPTIAADAIVHALLAPREETASAIAARFGAAFLHPDGSVDRASLGRLVFSDAEARVDLEAIVHPRVYARIDAWATAERQRGASWVLADIPLLFETRRAEDFDLVVVTTCPAPMQLTRLIARGLSADDAKARLGAQWPVEEKARQADYVIRTGGTFDETNEQVDLVLAEIDGRSVGRPS
jgi:dephospho-CoA kinase